MTLLRATASQVAAMAAERSAAAGRSSLLEAMATKRLATYGYAVSSSEERSWQNSLPVLAADLAAAGLGDVEMLLEYALPLTSLRADAVLAGVHPDTGEPSYVVVELKQWSAAHRFEGDDDLVEVPGMPGDPKGHPVAQVRSYCRYLTDFLATLEDQPDAVAGVAYLHNVTEPGAVVDLQRYEMDVSGRMFTGAQRADLHAWLRSRLASGADSAAAADRLLDSRVKPSKQLLKLAAEEVQHREQFVLMGDQQLAVDLVKHEVEASYGSDRGKRVIIVTGGPGSGKSVIALSLLGDLSRQGRSVVHATGSKSFTSTLRKVAGARAPRVQGMFKYFNQFIAAHANDLDVIVLDEAHRLRETSVDRYTRREQRTDRPQIDELIAAARVPVFLLDQHQVVRPGEMGSVEEIRAHAERLGLTVHQIDLGAQYRCGGSEAYVGWVQRLLGLDGVDEPTDAESAEQGVQPWEADPAFQVLLADSPTQMETFLRARLGEGYSSRMSAGYCWPWSDPTPEHGLVDDVVVGDWSMPWNVKGDRRIGDAPPSFLWATDDGGFEQVGCVYTAQGFEYDWNGVIIGPDLLWRDGRFTVDRTANRDPSLRSTKQVSDADVDRLVRHVYKVLLTRGMRGTVLHAVDPRTQEALRRLVAGSVAEAFTSQS